MAYIILRLFAVIFTVVGLAAFVRAIMFRIYKPKEDATIMLVSPNKGNCEDIEFTLRSCAVKVKWMGRVRPQRVLCLDNGMDKSTREICDIVCSEYDFMEVVSKEELDTILRSSRKAT